MSTLKTIYVDDELNELIESYMTEQKQKFSPAVCRILKEVLAEKMSLQKKCSKCSGLYDSAEKTCPICKITEVLNNPNAADNERFKAICQKIAYCEKTIKIQKARQAAGHELFNETELQHAESTLEVWTKKRDELEQDMKTAD